MDRQGIPSRFCYYPKLQMRKEKHKVITQLAQDYIASNMARSRLRPRYSGPKAVLVLIIKYEKQESLVRSLQGIPWRSGG